MSGWISMEWMLYMRKSERHTARAFQVPVFVRKMAAASEVDHFSDKNGECHKGILRVLNLMFPILADT